jgi:hypothetical protein
MTKQNLIRYLKQDGKSLGTLLSKLNQLEQWNRALRECLTHEPLLAEHCHIVNLSGHSLIALTDGAHWLTRIRFHIPELLPKLRNYPGLEHIRALCCRVEPTYTPRTKQKLRRTPKKLSKKSAVAVATDAKKITDKTLREALEKIADHIE